MKAKDLLQAMNDIDPKLLEGTEPWGEPAKKLHRPPWAVAVAAGLVLCVALGAGVMMANHGPQTASSEAGTLTAIPLPGAQELSAPDLEFAVNDTGKMQETGVLYEEGVTHRSLTLDELDYLRNQPGLSWMQDYYLLGNGLMDAQGNVILLQVMGYAPAVVEADPERFPMNQAPAFLLELAPGQNGTDVAPSVVREEQEQAREDDRSLSAVFSRLSQRHLISQAFGLSASHIQRRAAAGSLRRGILLPADNLICHRELICPSFGKPGIGHADRDLQLVFTRNLTSVFKFTGPFPGQQIPSACRQRQSPRQNQQNRNCLFHILEVGRTRRLRAAHPSR